MSHLMRKEKNKQVKEPLQNCRHTHNGIIAGKLKGHIPAQTPSGSLMQYVSIPLDALGINSPICRVAIPQAYSTTSTCKKERMTQRAHLDNMGLETTL